MRLSRAFALFSWIAVAVACNGAAQTTTVPYSFGEGGPVGTSSSGGGSHASTSTMAAVTPPVNDDPDTGSPNGTHLTGAGSTAPIPTGATRYITLVGGTVPTAPGTKVGYALTAVAPKTYQFRWTGEALVAGDGYHEFYGSLWTTGTFTSLIPGCVDDVCNLESGDFVSTAANVPGGQRIDWDTFASTGWDGFTFTTDTEPIYFDVYVDGDRHPELFAFPEYSSGADTSPASSPFAMSSEALPTDAGSGDAQAGGDAKAGDANAGDAKAGDARGD